MALLLDLRNNLSFFLYAHHSIGRLSGSVDTVLPEPEISKHHATIEWRDSQWQVRDLSRNGTWLSAQKIQPNQFLRLKKNDILSFAAMDNRVFKVLDTSPPTDCLVPFTADTPDLYQSIDLEQECLLPCEAKPQLELLFDINTNQWFCHPIESKESATVLSHGGIITLGPQRWQLWRCKATMQTIEITATAYAMTDLNFVFQLSSDEEQTHLHICIDKEPKTLDLGQHNHHYLVQHLARYKKADLEKGLHQQSQGWIHKDILMQELGIDETYLSVLVHRARKQFRKHTNIHDHQGIIERQPRSGLLRFGGFNCQINKGEQTLLGF